MRFIGIVTPIMATWLSLAQGRLQNKGKLFQETFPPASMLIQCNALHCIS